MRIKHRFNTAEEAGEYLSKRGWLEGHTTLQGTFWVCPTWPMGGERLVKKLRTGKWMIERTSGWELIDRRARQRRIDYGRQLLKSANVPV